MDETQETGGGLRPAPWFREIEIAWAAGLFEGEGCLNAYRRKSGKVQMQARLAMTDVDVVEKFARVVGMGHLRDVKQTSSNRKPLREWYVYEAEKVRALIALFLPYLGQRRRAKALEVLDMGADVREHCAKRTHCPNGHAYQGDNVTIENGKRRCRSCRNEQARNRARVRLGITPDHYRVTT